MAYRWLGVLLVLAVCTAGCGSTGTGGPRGEGGTGGGEGGTGGGGSGGTGGVGGAGGSQTQCLTSILCASCPTEGFCETSQDCSVGFVCIASGCETLGGAAINQCVFGTGGACVTTDTCPPERECMDVPGEGKRCVKTTPGCNSDFDCILGFTCESGSCVDRRVPCDTDVDCPKSHFCANGSNGKFCVRVHRACQNEFDCVGIAPSCADIDGDGSKECAGVKDPNAPAPVACVNAACADAAAPVCEVSGVWSNTECGQYGLCRTAGDCVAGFECVSLWPDGHKECVPNGGSCSSFNDCPVQQVCASPRDGGAPSCQAGLQP